MCTKLWISEECDYFLCKPCVKFYAKNWEEKKKLDMGNAGDKRHYENEEKGYDYGEE
jgi:hypothetical protein